jgi:predicted nucleotidyltransferase component of viral defense system
MIPKAVIHAVAKEESLRDTTIEKDYVLGWMLHGIAVHSALSRWVFKGGTCLKKCFFETYRFSEDLDFTVQAGDSLDKNTIEVALKAVCDWVAAESGIQFPGDGLSVEEYMNKQGTASFQAKVTYVGPLALARRSLQRIKFDITQYELLVDPPDRRHIFHRYADAPTSSAMITCYSVNEILAEKTRALYTSARAERETSTMSCTFVEASATTCHPSARERFSRRSLSSRHCPLRLWTGSWRASTTSRCE